MKRFNITVNGKAYDVAVEEITDGSAPVQAAAPSATAAPAAPAPAAAPAGAWAFHRSRSILAQLYKNRETMLRGRPIAPPFPAFYFNNESKNYCYSLKKPLE